MRTPQQAIALFREAYRRFTGNELPDDFPFTVTGNDHLLAPAGEFQFARPGDTGRPIAWVGLLVPERFTQKLSEDGLASVLGIELVNGLQERTAVEVSMADTLYENNQRYPDDEHAVEREQRVAEILYTAELDQLGSILTLSRKLEGDAEVIQWLAKARYDPDGVVEYLGILQDETLSRVTPKARIPARYAGLELRIQHAEHINHGRIADAEAIRTKYDTLKQAILR